MWFFKVFVISVLSLVAVLLHTLQLSAEELNSVRIAVVQYPIEGKQSTETLIKKVEGYVKIAAEKKSRLILFPEWLSLDVWPIDEKRSDAEVVEFVANDVTPVYWKSLKKLANKYKIIIAGGSTAYREGDKIFNAAAVVFPSGRIVLQKKNYLTAWEKKQGITPGSAGLRVIDMGWGKVVISICYDVEFPNLSADLAKSDIDLILVPSMTESGEGALRVRWAAQSRAVEHTSYVVVSPTIGETTKSWRHFGSGVILTPQLSNFPGVLKEGSGIGREIVVADIDLAKLHQAKKDSSWQPARDMRLQMSHIFSK